MKGTIAFLHLTGLRKLQVLMFYLPSKVDFTLCKFVIRDSNGTVVIIECSFRRHNNIRISQSVRRLRGLRWKY